MSVLDRLLLQLAPGWQAQRMRKRFEAERWQAAYDAARRSRRTQGWRTASSSANAETEEAGQLLRDRARDLVRNNPYAAAGLEVLVAYQVGYGIKPRPRTGDARLDRALTDAWNAWVPRADLGGMLDFYAIQAQAARCRAEAGEALVQMVRLSAAEARARGVTVPLAVQVLEPDLMPFDYERHGAGNQIRQSVELDRGGRPVARWLLEEHPGEPDRLGGTLTPTRRLGSEFLLHLYRQDRAGQLRGVPDLAPVMTRLRLLDEYEDAALMQAMAQATVAAFVTSDAPAARGPLEGVTSTGEPGKTLRPGVIERLLPGESVQFLTPSGTGPFSEFARHQLRAVATGFGLTYDLLTGDLTQANYSSLRAGRLAFKRRVEQAQWLMLVPRLCQPIWDAWVAAAVAVGEIPARAGGYPVEWGPPPFEFVDPLKDAEAERLMMRMGLKTWSQAVLEQGYDPVRQAEDIAADNERADGLGLILDGDPRRIAGTGAAQDATQNAVIEIAATGAAAPATDAAQ